MYLHQSRIRHIASIVAAALLLAGSAAAETKPRLDLSKIQIKNFGRTNDNYFRGAQPSDRDYSDLAAVGVRTVIDLTKDGKKDEAQLVSLSGMKFYRIPLTTSEAPSSAAVSQFLKLVNDPANWPVYVHCQGGRHRTGVMTAVYRMTQDGWSADKAYQEMKKYHFEGFPGHPELKRFVFDYYSKFAQARDVRPGDVETSAGIGK
jgi:protein tyrosine/serine phosphatase